MKYAWSMPMPEEHNIIVSVDNVRAAKVFGEALEALTKVYSDWYILLTANITAEEKIYKEWECKVRELEKQHKVDRELWDESMRAESEWKQLPEPAWWRFGYTRPPKPVPVEYPKWYTPPEPIKQSSNDSATALRTAFKAYYILIRNLVTLSKAAALPFQLEQAYVFDMVNWEESIEKRLDYLKVYFKIN
jgi:hypothetical protein